MRVHIHLEDDDSPVCAFLSNHVPSMGQEIVVEVSTGSPPNVIVTPTTYKVEKVIYHLFDVLAKDVPETHGTILYAPYAILLVSVIL